MSTDAEGQHRLPRAASGPEIPPTPPYWSKSRSLGLGAPSRQSERQGSPRRNARRAQRGWGPSLRVAREALSAQTPLLMEPGLFSRPLADEKAGQWLPLALWPVSPVRDLQVAALAVTGWYDNFMLNGELPHYFNIVGGKSLTNDIVSFDHEHSILNSLIGAINAITKQNFIDLYNQDYHDEIIRMVQQRHPTYKRSDISYMMVNAENILKANENPGR